MAMYHTNENVVTADNSAEYIETSEVTPEFFSVFQISPVTGRLFNADDGKKGAAGTAIVSDRYWQSHFAGKPLAGQTLKVREHTVSIVGVLPPGMHFPGKTQVWFPINNISDENQFRSGHNYLAVARLRPDVTVAQAQVQMSAIGTRLAQQYPDSNKQKNVLVTPMREEMVSSIRLTLVLLLGAVGVVLLIACGNMANLLLAKASGRVREMAIRAAVGASRGRIIRQLITEGMVLSVLAAIAALVLATWASHSLVALAPAGVPRINETATDSSVLIFTLLLAVAASILFGLAPALHLSRLDLYESLKPGSGRGTGRGRGSGLRSALVVAQVALSVVLLAGAGLLIKSFVALHNVDLGFRTENLLIMETDVPATGNFPPSPEELKSLQHATGVYRDLIAQVEAMPGVTSAGMTRDIPMNPTSNGGYWIDNAPMPGVAEAPNAVFSVVSQGTFAALGMPVTRGRDFQDGDSYDAPFTAIINQALVRRSFANQDPIGHTIFCGLDSLKGMRIVGVVADVRQNGPAVDPAPQIYMPFQQHPLASTALNLVVLSTLPPSALESALQNKMKALSPDSPVRFSTITTELSENIATPRFQTLLIGIFAGLALALAMVGIYGVMSYVVSQSTNEIGVRMALGASQGNVLRLILAQALGLSLGGLLVGLAGALALTRLMKSMLFMVKPTDPLTLVTVSAVLLLVAVAASYLPARRATKVDPLVAMRYE
jgi:predicted permease